MLGVVLSMLQLEARGFRKEGGTKWQDQRDRAHARICARAACWESFARAYTPCSESSKRLLYADLSLTVLLSTSSALLKSYTFLECLTHAILLANDIICLLKVE